MHTHSLRVALREHTEDVHARLDETIGAFTALEGYRTFLLNSFRFRQLAEPACRSSATWSPQRLLGALAADLGDLGITSISDSVEPIELASSAARLGALYVLEGSALGARLLLRRAEHLGLSHIYGARHLALQVADPQRWPAFLAFLEARDAEPAFDQSAAVASARMLFERALDIYRS